MISDNNNSNSSDQSLFKLIWQWLVPDKRLIQVLVFVMLINVVLSIFGPILLQQSIGRILEENENRYTLYLAFGYAFSLLLIFVILMIQGLLVSKINSQFIHRIRSNAFEKIIENKISFFDNSEVGNLVSRITNDTSELADSGNRFANAFSQIIIFFGVLSVMLYYNPLLTIAAIAVTPLLFLTIISLRKFQRNIARRWRQNLAQVNTRFGEVMGSIAISKTFGREERNKILFKELNEETYQSAKRRGQVIFANGPFSDFIRTCGLILLLFVSSQQLSQGENVATIYLFIMLQTFLYDPITNIARSYSQFQSSFAALDRLIAIMADKDTSEDQGQGRTVKNLKGNIVFNNVSFSYDDEEQVLDDISFSITSGERVALVGHTGAGKSTIAALLMRFYEINNGELLIDDLPITDYNLKDLRKEIGYVAQDVRLLGTTIRENFILSKPSSTESEILNVLKRIHALEFLENLPEGLDTKIHQGGTNLSQGQKQMLSLARALLVDPKILILDEFTSSLDLYTESKIQDALEELLRGRTSIIIAHRLTTILKSDNIIVLNQGKITEQGTHTSLIQKNGEYSQIYNKYFSFQMADLKPIVKI